MDRAVKALGVFRNEIEYRRGIRRDADCAIGGCEYLRRRHPANSDQPVSKGLAKARQEFDIPAAIFVCGPDAAPPRGRAGRAPDPLRPGAHHHWRRYDWLTPSERSEPRLRKPPLALTVKSNEPGEIPASPSLGCWQPGRYNSIDDLRRPSRPRTPTRKTPVSLPRVAEAIRIR